jgi:hypothetical protein
MVLLNGSGSFLPSSSSLLPTSRPCVMPKPTQPKKTGEILLDIVKATETEELAARTALAIERYQSSSSSVPEQLEPEQIELVESADLADQPTLPSLRGGAIWARHDFGSSDLLVFSHGDGEILTIRKSPTGEGWIIIYDEPVGYCPE